MFDYMTRTVVAGIDGSDYSTKAALWAANEAERRGLPLRLLHTYLSLGGSVPSTVMVPEEYFDAPRRLAHGIATRTAGAVIHQFPGLDVHSTLHSGAPAPALIAASEHADLTVVGTRGKHRSTLGSVAVKVAEHATGPVVVVPEHSTVDSSAGVLVGTDGSDESEPALRFAFEFAAGRAVPLTVVHSWDEAPLDDLQRATLLPVNRAVIDEEHATLLRDQVAPWAEKFPEVTVHELVGRGRPDAVLLHEAQRLQPSLIVIGSRGRGAFRGLLLGSTSRRVIVHAEHPVAVIRN